MVPNAPSVVVRSLFTTFASRLDVIRHIRSGMPELRRIAMKDSHTSVRSSSVVLALHIVGLLTCFVPLHAQTNSTVIPFLATGYKYQQVAWGSLSGFEDPSYNDITWATGQAGFGTFPSPCPLNNSTYVKTPWTANTDMLIRKHFNLPGGARNLRIHVAVDNDVQVFINGVDVSVGLQTHDGCATRESFVFTVSDQVLLAGDNVLAVRGRDRGNTTYLDVELTADLPTVIFVNSTLDSPFGLPGENGTLRDAIIAANSTPVIDTIKFELPGSGVHTFNLLSSLPTIIHPIVIDGTTQPGFADRPIIELNGSNAGEAATGLNIATENSTVQGLIINRFDGTGIIITTPGELSPRGESSSLNLIIGNYIGTDSTGSIALGNGEDGVALTNYSSGNTVMGNVISGNGRAGIAIGRSGSPSYYNVVIGNHIGTNAAGTAAIPNVFEGVLINDGSSDNRVGGYEPSDGNLISGNLGSGIGIINGSRNHVAGNRIGTDLTGTLPLGNHGSGVVIDSTYLSVELNQIGGSNVSGAGVNIGNTLAYNQRAGVTLKAGRRNAVLSNAIFKNGLLGIDLNGDGITPNHTPGTADGPNNLQNYPILRCIGFTGGAGVSPWHCVPNIFH
jgi:parallel beta-helix repeat protein